MESKPSLAQMVSSSRRVLLFARHGERQDFVTPWTPDCAWAEADPPVSDRGYKQAQQLASHLLSSGIKIERIICSPYLRTLQTAYVIAKTFKKACPELAPVICMESGICDWHRDWLNKLPHVDPAEYIAKECKDDLNLLDQSYVPQYTISHFQNMRHEPFPEFVKRIKVVMANVVKLVQQSPEACVLFMGHAATSIVCVRAVLGSDTLPVRAPVCSLSAVHERRVVVEDDARKQEETHAQTQQALLSPTSPLMQYILPPCKAPRKSSCFPPEDGCMWHWATNGDVSFLSDGEQHLWVLPGEEQLYVAPNSPRPVRKKTRGEK